MFFLVLIFCALAVFTLWDWFNRDAKLMRKIPGPKAWPIVGNSLSYVGSPDAIEESRRRVLLHANVPIHPPGVFEAVIKECGFTELDHPPHRSGLAQKKVFLSMRSLQKQYGPIVQIHAMSVRMVNISNPEDFEKLMSSSEYITKADPYKFAVPWLGDGLLLSTGKKWHQRRKLLTKAFHFNILKKFMVTFKQETEHFLKQVEKEIVKDKTDLFAIVSPATLRVICDTAMGISIGEDKVAFKKYLESVTTIGECLMTRLSQAFLHNDYLFHLSKIAKIQKRVLTDLHGFTRKVVAERRQVLDEKNSQQEYENNKKMALLNLLLENEKLGVIDNDGIRDEVDTFMFAGYDTTTVALSFFMMAIANEPFIQDKIYEELVRILRGTQTSPTMDELNEMKYLECCIKESLRLYPSVPFIGRKLLKDTVLSGYTVPANTSCFFMIYDLHRNADIFPDPERFDPDRFLPENCAKRIVYSYVPFSAGLRNCIGQKFAMLEIKMLVSGLLRRFRVEPVTRPADLTFKSDLVLRTSNPIYVRFRLRN